MNATEILSNTSFNDKTQINFLFTMPAHSHYKNGAMNWGRVFPTTKGQVRYFLRKRIAFDLLTCKDVRMIEEFCTKHGFGGMCRYRLTSSGKYARLTNDIALIEAWRAEYGVRFRY